MNPTSRLYDFVRLALIVLIFVATSAAQGPLPPVVPTGFILVDDLILPASAVLGDAVYTAVPWPGGVIPYVFHSNVDATNQARSLTAMAEWEAVSAVDFVPRTTESDYIRFVSSTSNSSFVGVVGGMQNVNMVSWSTKYVICHELYHAMGFLHEQSRPDRDAYVTIEFGNIQSGYAGNFQINAAAVPVGAYDFLSIMHYGPCAFSTSCPAGTQCGCSAPTIVCQPPYAAFQNQMGQRQYMTSQDAQGLAARYGAPLPPTITALTPSVVTNGSASFTLNVTGTRFFQGSPNANGVQGSRIRWDGTDLPTSYVDPTQLTATVPAHLLLTTSCVAITVHNPPPAGGLSNVANFFVTSEPTTASVTSYPSVCGVGALTLSAAPVLGSPITLDLVGAPASQSGFLLVVPGAPVPLPLGPDCILYVDPTAALILPLTTDPLGNWSIPAMFPADPCLAGFRAALQAGVTDPASILGWDLTNALDVRYGY